MAQLPPAILLMGPTASGKTDLAIALREQLPVELISVDSAMIYRGMDIGTAKPSSEELVRAPHRLIDICDPAESYSAAQFCEDAHSTAGRWDHAVLPCAAIRFVEIAPGRCRCARPSTGGVGERGTPGAA